MRMELRKKRLAIKQKAEELFYRYIDISKSRRKANVYLGKV